MPRHWTTQLKKLHACDDAVAWAVAYSTLEEAWAACKRGDWMLWYAGKLSGPPDSDSRKRLVMAACACARLSLPPEQEVLKAIETTEAYCRGEASLEEVRAASALFVYAAHAALATTAAASFAAASAYTASTAPSAAAIRKGLAKCADIVRQHYPTTGELRMINHDTLMAVQAEVTRFQAALDAVREEERDRRKAAKRPSLPTEAWRGGAYEGSPETAALRRASMDLTRALADLRRSA